MAWTTVELLATELGVESTDPRLVTPVAAAIEYCQQQRNDLDPDAAPPARIGLATLLYAAHLFRRRPDGQPATYDELGDYQAQETMTEVYRLLGNRKPRAR